MNLTALNKEFRPLGPLERLEKLEQYFGKNEMLYTSSFGTTSAVLLHMVSKALPHQVVHFINTSFLFKETLDYKLLLSELLNLDVVELLPDEKNNAFTAIDRTWEKDADLCCTVNKLMPLEAIKPMFSVWISGLMGHQNEFRLSKEVFEYDNGLVKFYPLIDWSPIMVKSYILEHGLPQHPLWAKGFSSVGCTHCTVAGCGRDGRWNGQSKTECGLHSTKVKKAS
ncbi:MAG: phosphoadenylyl-sulfate reductase [Bacteroidota bacterium]